MRARRESALPATAEFHKEAIMEKLKLRTSAQLTRYAIDHGIES